MESYEHLIVKSCKRADELLECATQDNPQWPKARNTNPTEIALARNVHRSIQKSDDCIRSHLATRGCYTSDGSKIIIVRRSAMTTRVTVPTSTTVPELACEEVD